MFHFWLVLATKLSTSRLHMEAAWTVRSQATLHCPHNMTSRTFQFWVLHL